MRAAMTAPVSPVALRATLARSEAPAGGIVAEGTSVAALVTVGVSASGLRDSEPLGAEATPLGYGTAHDRAVRRRRVHAQPPGVPGAHARCTREPGCVVPDPRG